MTRALGKRPRGRPLGSKTKYPRPPSEPPGREKLPPAAALIRAKAVGELPLTYMCRIMNDPNIDPHRRDRMAELAAPYLHPKLSKILINEGKGGDMHVVQINVQGVPTGHDFTGAPFNFDAPRLPAPLIAAVAIEPLDEPEASADQPVVEVPEPEPSPAPREIPREPDPGFTLVRSKPRRPYG